MTTIYKYQGAGNDFVIIDNRNGKLNNITSESVKKLCNRRYGIGSDGLMLLNKSDKSDFEMIYFNSDGSGSTLCGNGARCIVAFAYKLGIISNSTVFNASDGLHEAFVVEPDYIRLKMSDVNSVQLFNGDYITDTGSPHYVKFIESIDQINVVEEGKKVRYSDKFIKTGINVNFIQLKGTMIHTATYERGVEDETLACGTGAVAMALALAEKNKINKAEYILNTKGGLLGVEFEKKSNIYTNIWLSGKAEFVFKTGISV